MPAQDKWLAGLALTCLAASGFSAAAAPDWENEQIVHINTEPPRATFVPFADVAGALAGNPEASPFFYLYPKYWEVKKVLWTLTGRPLVPRTILFFRAKPLPCRWQKCD